MEESGWNKADPGVMRLGEVIDQVRIFHEAFGIACADGPLGDVGEARARLRHELMREENAEYMAAAERGDLVEVADALGDMLYILCGTILTHGLQHKIEEVFQEIQRSNMSKLGADGRPVYRADGKVLKGEHYRRPDIARILVS